MKLVSPCGSFADPGDLLLSRGLRTCAYAGALEDWVEIADDPEAAAEWVEHLAANPVNLASASFAELAGLPLFDNQAIRAILRLRSRLQDRMTMADVRSLAELSAAQLAVIEQLGQVRHAWEYRGRARISARTSGLRRDSQAARNIHATAALHTESQSVEAAAHLPHAAGGNDVIEMPSLGCASVRRFDRFRHDRRLPGGYRERFALFRHAHLSLLGSRCVRQRTE